MESLQFLLEGFATAATPVNLLLALLGVVIGTAVGVLPGIGPAIRWRCSCQSRTGWSRPAQ